MTIASTETTEQIAKIQRRLDSLVAQCAAIQVAVRKIIELLQQRMAGEDRPDG